MGFFQKLFIPHESNRYHPHSTRFYTLVAYALIFFVANFFIFPYFGITSGHALAASIDTDELISMANRDRRARGLGDLSKNSNLIRAANAKGSDMFAKQYWSHVGPNGETPWQFIHAAGYNYIYAGENLAKNFSTSNEAHLAWMNSPTHRSNILNQNYRDIGIAAVNGQLNGKPATIIVAMFGSKEYSKNIARTANQTAQPTSAPTPLPTKAIETYKPTIQSPEDGTTVNKSDIKISGIAEVGDTIKVFSNEKLLGELPKDQINYTVNVKLLDEHNLVYIKSKEAQTGKESLSSDTTKIDIDTTPPDVTRVYTEVYEENNSTTIIVKPEEVLGSVDLQFGNQLLTLGQKDEEFYTSFNSGDFKVITLFLYDEVGNVSSKQINLSEVIKNNGSIPSYINSTKVNSNSPTGWLENYLAKFGTKEKINLILVTVFFMILTFDAIFLIKKGRVREWASHHAFHIALIFLLTIGIITI